MKKVLSLLLLVCCLATLCACGGKNADASSANKIVYGEKYVSANAMNSEETCELYYIIEKDCLKKYTYDENGRDVWHYIATFKYEIIEEGKLVYFFDSIEIYEDDNQTKMKNACVDNGVIEFSENVLIIDDGPLYVRESYLEEELTNFGKPQ